MSKFKLYDLEKVYTNRVLTIGAKTEDSTSGFASFRLDVVLYWMTSWNCYSGFCFCEINISFFLWTQQAWALSRYQCPSAGKNNLLGEEER